MHAIIVVAHHDPRSLTHGLAGQVAAGLATKGHTFEIADLAAEGFDPRYTAADHAVYRGQATPPADVRAEQARIDRADALVVVYPVYWWSMPGLLKGWIDRVFSNGWAIEYDIQTTRLVKKLGGLQVHLLGVGGTDEGTFERHGYDKAMNTQIDHGIFDYCGAKVVSSQLLLESEIREPKVHLEAAWRTGQGMFAEQNQQVALSI
ncbi:NAD(P)H-dependent oxidoreductase [Pseudomonas fluorescens]|uniref:NAD(P)H-dependent oxidoreductase n=1 Tax=Pseudomonas fluorescens TaxID=294 RepID=UPI001BE520E8|nr:NAD(P)H-dependent oxidoreductase [Pseudomonas fluorescens]MBT2372156.1 NAD(P)H-dependent oxidoreductase [Pseudomonas fluorescens]